MECCQSKIHGQMPVLGYQKEPWPAMAHSCLQHLLPSCSFVLGSISTHASSVAFPPGQIYLEGFGWPLSVVSWLSFSSGRVGYGYSYVGQAVLLGCLWGETVFGQSSSSFFCHFPSSFSFFFLPLGFPWLFGTSFQWLLGCPLSEHLAVFRLSCDALGFLVYAAALLSFPIG